jgi:hypothetical protein
MWQVTPQEEPVIHRNEGGQLLAGPSEVGLKQSLDDSGVMEPGEEEMGDEADSSGAQGFVMPTLSEETVARAEALAKALKHLEALEKADRVLMKTPSQPVPPRAREEQCRLCERACRNVDRHNLGDCPQFLVMGLSERERTAVEFACGVCLSVEHYTSFCPCSQRECGIYGCRLQHHPLLHRVQYLEPISAQDDQRCNWPRHQQSRQDDAVKDEDCVLCQDQHDTKECPLWPEESSDRITKAGLAYICTMCLRGEHSYCPAAQIICGVNRCVEHHDPFFHFGQARDLSGQPGNSGDNWKDLQEAHRRWTADLDQVFKRHQLISRHERVRVLEQMGPGPHQALTERYENTFLRLPPYTIRRTKNGDITMTERTFRVLAEGYEHAGEMAKQLTMSSLKQLLLNMDKGVRQTLMAEELAVARGNPYRYRMLTQEEGESDESYAFRLAKRAVALELNPPTAEDRRRVRRLWGEDSESETEESSGSESGPSGGASRARQDRPVLSGNPEEEDWDEMQDS